MTEIAGGRVLITGAASGMGRLLALESAARGARLVLLDIDATGLEKIRQALVRSGSEAAAYVCDLCDPEAIEVTARRITSEHGGVDVLVNNAGVVSGKTVTELRDDDVVRTLATNTLAPIRLIRAFLPAMIERDRGHIVNISSAGGLVASSRLADYSASKFALFGFDEALRVELRRRGSAVRTTIVCPYYMDTGMFAGVTTRFRWLLPILDPDLVAGRIITAIERDRRRLIMPWFVYTGWPLRLLPVDLFDALADLFGISRSMDTFAGRCPRGTSPPTDRSG